MTNTPSKASPKKAATPSAPTRTPTASKKRVAKPVVAEPTPASLKSRVKAAVAPVAEVVPAKAVAPAKKTPRTTAATPAKTSVAKKPQAPVNATRDGATVKVISNEQRYRMIAEAAYFRAESHQFKSDPVRDWIEAEAAVAALLDAGR